MSVVFLAVNIAAGTVIILLSRALSVKFIALNEPGDPMLILLSVIQGSIFHLWRRS
jgi:hypothetical protein